MKIKMMTDEMAKELDEALDEIHQFSMGRARLMPGDETEDVKCVALILSCAATQLKEMIENGILDKKKAQLLTVASFMDFIDI